MEPVPDATPVENGYTGAMRRLVLVVAALLPACEFRIADGPAAEAGRDTARGVDPPAHDAAFDASPVPCLERPLLTCPVDPGDTRQATLDRQFESEVMGCFDAGYACGDVTARFEGGCMVALDGTRDRHPAFFGCLGDRLATERWSCGEGTTTVHLGDCLD